MEDMKQILFEKKDTGIEMSFLLYIPNEINNESTLILNGITQGVGTKEALEKDEKENSRTYGTYLDSYKEALQVATKGYFSPIYKKLAVDYNNPMLIPIIPRCNGLYTGFLGYDVYHENYDRAIKAYEAGWSNFTKEDLEKFRKLDTQIVNMIYYAIGYINERYNLSLDYKVIATGYSASSKMVNYFTALHPELVKMVIAGGTGGLIIIPTKEFNYPLGFKDLKDENLKLYKKIPQFYYIGIDDQNDPSRPQFEIQSDNNGDILYDELGNVKPKIEDGQIKFLRDEKGNYILRDGGYYSLEQTHFIHPKYSDVQKRFDRIKSIYNDQEIDNVIFKKYKGNHIIEDDRLVSDILYFYESNMPKKTDNKGFNNCY